MDRFFDRGGNFIDTARVYADWLPGGHGASEKTVGAWLKQNKRRGRVIISTKGAHPDLKTMNVPRMSVEEIRSDLEESLNDLCTDYIDLYFLHRDDVSRPVVEILQTLEIFRREGKIRYYGCSNWSLQRMIEAEEAAFRLGIPGFVCDQIRFGLADLNDAKIADRTAVSMDSEIYNWHQKTLMPVMAYTSSCNGYFSKKLKGLPVSAPLEEIYGNAANSKILEKLLQWEKDCRVPASVLVCSYVMNQKFPSVPISAFSSLDQMDELLSAADFDFPHEILDEITNLKKFLI